MGAEGRTQLCAWLRGSRNPMSRAGDLVLGYPRDRRFQKAAEVRYPVMAAAAAHGGGVLAGILRIFRMILGNKQCGGSESGIYKGEIAYTITGHSCSPSLLQRRFPRHPGTPARRADGCQDSGAFDRYDPALGLKEAHRVCQTWLPRHVSTRVYPRPDKLFSS